MKFLLSEVVFQEIPDEIILAIDITNCPFRCPGCHSPELWEDIGEELTTSTLETLIEENKGITCVCFMGGDYNPEYLSLLASFIKVTYPKLKVALYSGSESFPPVDLSNFDYIKVGPYIQEKGGLDNPNTNQKLFKKEALVEETSGEILYCWTDITYKLWKSI